MGFDKSISVDSVGSSSVSVLSLTCSAESESSVGSATLFTIVEMVGIAKFSLPCTASGK